jgi:hypothetical protein
LTNATQSPGSSVYKTLSTVLYPLEVVATPLLWTVDTVSSVVQGFFGYFLRIGVFSFGEWNRSWVKRQIINLYKGGCYDVRPRKKFDPERLEKAFRTLEMVGGVRSFPYTKDGVKLDSMLLRYRDVKKTIESHGGKIVHSLPIEKFEKRGDEAIRPCKENHRTPNAFVDIILPSKETEEWQSFSKEVLANLGLKQVTIELCSGKVVDAFIVASWRTKNPTRPKPNQCFVRCNSPTESYPMAKKDIMRRVFALQGDALCFDYRGTWHSEGFPTEGGYYLDAETLVEKAANDYGYKWSDIWADGFCLGSAVSVHLKKKYHERGINFFAQNAFDKMEHTLHAQAFPANLLSPLGLEEIQSKDPHVRSLVKQDNFNNLAKLNSLEGKKGTSILVNTNTDTTINPDSYALLATALHRVSQKTHSLIHYPRNQKANGHGADVNNSGKIWDQVVACITAKDNPSILKTSPTHCFSWIVDRLFPE